LDVVHQVCHQFEEQAGVMVNKLYASYPSFQKDLSKIVELLEEEQMFYVQIGCSLKAHNRDIMMSSVKWENSWVKDKLIK